MTDRKIAVVGLGYVGLPVAVEFSKKQHIIGFDISERRIRELINGTDITNEVADADLAEASIQFTHDPSTLKNADFIIVAVPTPINENKQHDLTPLLKASEAVASHLSQGTFIVYES